MNKTKWLLKKSEVNVELMSSVLGVNPIIAAILGNRGIKTKSGALSFLNPRLDSFIDMSDMADVNSAIELILKGIADKKKITVCGDYDADGIMSTVILLKALKNLGADASYNIPHRETDGYGLNTRIITDLHNRGTEMIITCDNGISAIEEIKLAKEYGMSVVIIDHHEPLFETDINGNKRDIMPLADAIVDPKRSDCSYPFKLLCAAGLCYKFVRLMYEKAERPLEFDKELLSLATIATLCDVVDLVSENRVIAKNGIDIINTDKDLNLGLSMLIEKRQLRQKRIGTFEIGYILGPCINATGRLDDASIAVELFTTEDLGYADNLADKLIELNNERKNLTKNALEQAVSDISQVDLVQKPIIVYYMPIIHESVAGIVAGRLKEYFKHPAIVLTDSNGLVKGSARSIEHYNIFENLLQNKDLFIKFGGHEMAAGVTLVKENVETLDRRLNENCMLTEENFIETIRIDKEMALQDINLKLVKELQILYPYGKGNHEPVFGTKNIYAESVEIIGETRKTLRLIFMINGRYKTLKAVCFDKVAAMTDLIKKQKGESFAEKFAAGGAVANIKMDIVYTLELNEYNGNEYVNMKILDFRCD